jgi:hypothetical protein
MIEVSITEIALFTWAIIATGAALKYRHEKHVSVCIMQALLSDEEMRDKAVRSWREFETSRLKGE